MPLKNRFNFGSRSDRGPTIPLNIGVNVFDFNIFTEANAVATEELPSDNVQNGTIVITIENTIVVGATLIGVKAMQSGTGWGTGWVIDIIVQGSSTARIQGAGGVGGDGAIASFIPPNAEPRGQFGGGGGGAGSVAGLGGIRLGLAGTKDAGGAGVSELFIFSAPLPAEAVATVGGDGGTALFLNTAGPDIHLRPEALATLEIFGGGGGGGGQEGVLLAPNSGAGGDPGLDGITSSGAAGGNNGLGAEIEGAATFFQDGPGTIDILGV